MEMDQQRRSSSVEVHVTARKVGKAEQGQRQMTTSGEDVLKVRHV